MLAKEIGLLGGTGDLGRALAIHLVSKYQVVKIGSRSADKAAAVAAEICSSEVIEKKGRESSDEIGKLIGVENDDVARSSEIIIATLPFEVAIETIEPLVGELKGDQLLVSAVARVEKRGNEFEAPQLDQSVAEQIRDIVPDSVRMASAFQTIPARVLYYRERLESDVLVACDEVSTFDEVKEIVSAIEGLRALHAGSLGQSRHLEELTSVLLNVGSRNQLRNPSFKVLSF